MTTQPPTTETAQPKHSPGELFALAMFFCATLFSATAFACRWLINVQSQTVYLSLVLASLTAALMLLGRNHVRSGLEKTARAAFALMVTISLLAWSPGIAFALMVALPVIMAVAVPPLLERCGYRLEMKSLGPTRGLPQRTDEFTSATTVEPVPTIPSAVPSAVVSASKSDIPLATSTINSSEFNELNAGDESEEQDPWQFLHSQFAAEPALNQNIAQWLEPDGSRCIVANIRCRFSTADETCIAHVPFWPILCGRPEVYCRVASGPAASIKTTQELPHGLRLEIRLEDRSSGQDIENMGDVIVEVVASLAAEPIESAA